MNRVEGFEATDIDNLQFKMNHWLYNHDGFAVIQIVFHPPYKTASDRMCFTAIIHYKK